MTIVSSTRYRYFSHHKLREHTIINMLVHLLLSPIVFSLFFMVPKGSIAIHLIQFQMTVRSQLFFEDVVLGGEHLADLHKGFVLGLRNDEERVAGHSQADRTEDQVTERACINLRCRTHRLIRLKCKLFKESKMKPSLSCTVIVV